MSSDLKSCPFCGGNARIIAKPYEPKVCVGCGDDSEKEATEAWNRRADIIEPSCDRDALLKVADMLECDGECSERECGKGTFCEAPTIAAARISEELEVEL